MIYTHLPGFTNCIIINSILSWMIKGDNFSIDMNWRHKENIHSTTNIIKTRIKIGKILTRKIICNSFNVYCCSTCKCNEQHISYPYVSFAFMPCCWKYHFETQYCPVYFRISLRHLMDEFTFLFQENVSDSMLRICCVKCI